MKIRSDFVSNSSSSSFIISTSHNADEVEFLVEKNFTPTDTDRIQTKYITMIRRTNRDTISVGLRNNVVLFLGDYVENTGTENKVYIYSPVINKYNHLQKDLLNHKEWFYCPKFEMNHNESVLDDQAPKKCTPEQAKDQFIETLTDSLHSYWESCNQAYIFQLCNYCGEITKDTLKLTDLMVEYEMNIKVDKKLYAKIKKELEDGKHVYYIQANDDGEGIEYGSIYISRTLDYDIEDIDKNISKISDFKVLKVIE